MINTTKHQNDVVPSIWIICKNGLLVSIPLSNILEQKKDLIMAYQLTSQSTYRDVVLYPYIYYNSPSSSSDIVAQMEMDNDDDDATIYPNHAIVLNDLRYDHIQDRVIAHDDCHDDDGDDGHSSRFRCSQRSRRMMAGKFI